jgi:hypothetical protein
MTEAKHTPGPWRIDATANIDCGHYRISGGIVGPNGDPVVIADPSQSEYAPALDLNSADARLIAAAPDLLAVCREFIDALGPDGYHRVPGYPATQRMRAAIAKAEGR